MTLAKISNFTPSLHLSFKRVHGAKHEERWKIVTEAFKTIIQPLCGSQQEALATIKQNQDRTCRLLFDQQTAVGCLVYKTVLTNEFSKFGLSNSLEINSLFLLNPDDKAKGYRSEMLRKAQWVASKLGATSIHVTIQEQSKDCLAFFQKKQFERLHSFDKEHFKDKGSFLLAKVLQKDQGIATSDEAETKVHKEEEDMQTSSDEPKKKKEVSKKHPDHPKNDLEEPPAKRQKVEPNSNNSNNQNHSSYPRANYSSSNYRFPYSNSTDENNGTSQSNTRGIDKIPLKKEYIRLISSRQKTVEGRINSYPFNKLKAGQVITFFAGDRSINCLITKVTTYKTFRDMLMNEGVTACFGRNVTHPDEGVSIYESIPNYEGRAKRFGVLAIRIKYMQ